MSPPEDGDLEVVVRHIRTESSQIRSFELRPWPGEKLPSFEAGAHVDVFPQSGLCRQYSLANDPDDSSRYILGVKREQNSRGGSTAMHNLVSEGSRLSISYPRNNFALRANSGRSLLIAGGIGITPLLSMAQALATKKADFELHYFADSNQNLAFRDLIVASSWYGRVFFHLGVHPPLLNDVLDDILRAPGADDLVYLCGPNPFMEVVSSASEQAGWSPDSLILEHFAAQPPRLVPGEGEFVVRLPRRGIELIVRSDQTVIEVLRRAGVQVKTACEQGVCGTCMTSILEGEPDHNDLYLTGDEQASGYFMMPCVSRAKSDLLVLDI